MTQPEPAEPQHTQIEIGELEKWLEVYRKANKKIAELEEMKDQAKAKVTELLESEGADEGLVNGKLAVTWHTRTSRNLDTRKLRADYPELADEYTRVKQSRVFQPKDL